jgi:hypothetical protein
MALLTNTLGQAGPATFSYDYDSVTMLIQTVRCVNNGDQPAYFKAERNSDGAFVEKVCPPFATTTQTVPQGAAAQLKVVQVGPNKFTGVATTMMYPAP